MKKAVIMEMRDEFVIGLSEGQFIKLKKKKHMDVGQEILFSEKDILKTRQLPSNWKQYASAAAACIVIIMFSMIYYVNNMMVYAVVTVDINPSVELKLNRQNEVIEIEAMNDDGAELLNVDIGGLTIDEAISVLVDEAYADGFLDPVEGDYVMVTTVPVRNNEEVNKVIQNEIKLRVDSDKTLQSVNIALVESTTDELNQAVIEEKPLGLIAISDETDLTDVDTVEAFFDNQENVRIFEKKNKIIYKFKTEDGQHVEVEIETEEDGTTIEVEVKDPGSNGNAFGKSKDKDDDLDDDNLDDDDFDDDEDDDDSNLDSLEDFIEKLMVIQDDIKEVKEFVAMAQAEIEKDLDEYKDLRNDAKDLWEIYKDQWQQGIQDQDRDRDSEDDEFEGEREREDEDREENEGKNQNRNRGKDDDEDEDDDEEDEDDDEDEEDDD